ncbi:hypothetical protein CLV48_101373 [Cecembia rubra]|uniref:Uncharacterized protein n=1 Tax=Cecembia rubra TaxID=1485585 RepID=A0A2P8EDA5_9BACT|nr:hypothetical protein CLV48_101373 [Cecembia rubra]
MNGFIYQYLIIISLKLVKKPKMYLFGNFVNKKMPHENKIIGH